MPDDTAHSQLAAQSRLADVRLRVLNRERVPPEEFRSLLLDLMRSREATAAQAKSASARKSRENKKASAPQQTFNLADLFGPKG